MKRDPKTFIKTAIGLPNTCVITKEPVTEGYWYSPTILTAQGGEGYSESAYQQLLDEQAKVPSPTAPDANSEPTTSEPATVSRETSEGRVSSPRIARRAVRLTPAGVASLDVPPAPSATA